MMHIPILWWNIWKVANYFLGSGKRKGFLRPKPLKSWRNSFQLFILCTIKVWFIVTLNLRYVVLSLLDNASNYLVGCVIQKRLLILVTEAYMEKYLGTEIITVFWIFLKPYLVHVFFHFEPTDIIKPKNLYIQFQLLQSTKRCRP